MVKKKVGMGDREEKPLWGCPCVAGGGRVGMEDK